MPDSSLNALSAAKREPWGFIAFVGRGWPFALGYWASCGVLSAASGRVGFVIGASLWAIAVVLCHLITKGRTRGHRRTDGDRDDPGTGVTAYIATEGGTVNLTGSVSSFTLHTTSPGVDKAVPLRDAEEPIRAWKRANLVIERGLVRFGAMGVDERYSVDGHAHCSSQYRLSSLWWGEARVPHGATPSLSCRCGFYAWTERDDAFKVYPTAALLEVDLFGTVIVHERGYRASRQRVLAVWLPKTCASSLCAADATEVAEVDKQVLGFCSQHASLVPETALSARGTTSDLAALIGTEVRWLDA